MHKSSTEAAGAYSSLYPHGECRSVVPQPTNMVLLAKNGTKRISDPLRPPARGMYTSIVSGELAIT
jgi:hypothetical protein